MRARALAVERELLVGDRRERQAMKRGDAVRADRRAVLRGGITHVRVEIPLGMAVGHAPHVAVAGDLGEHRGGGNRCALGVTTDDGTMLVAEVRELEAVHQAQGIVAGDAAKRSSQPGDVRDMKAARVDAAHATHNYRRLRGGPQDERVELLAGRFGVLLGVVQPCERAAVREREALDVE